MIDIRPRDSTKSDSRKTHSVKSQPGKLTPENSLPKIHSQRFTPKDSLPKTHYPKIHPRENSLLRKPTSGNPNLKNTSLNNKFPPKA